MFTISHKLISEISLLGMGLDMLGGCYLAYDLLGGKTGPLQIISRSAGYTTLFLIGYTFVLGLRYAIIAAFGMGILLALEYKFVSDAKRRNEQPSKAHIMFGFLRGVVLGLAGMSVVGAKFGMVFGLLSGIGLSATYSMGFAPADDYTAQAKPHISLHKFIASMWRAIAVSISGIVAGALSHQSQSNWALLGLKLGLAAGVVSALVGLLSPVLEWRINNLAERRLGLIGLAMIFVGMLLQSAQYWAVVYSIKVG